MAEAENSLGVFFFFLFATLRFGHRDVLNQFLQLLVTIFNDFLKNSS